MRRVYRHALSTGYLFSAVSALPAPALQLRSGGVLGTVESLGSGPLSDGASTPIVNAPINAPLILPGLPSLSNNDPTVNEPAVNVPTVNPPSALENDPSTDLAVVQVALTPSLPAASDGLVFDLTTNFLLDPATGQFYDPQTGALLLLDEKFNFPIDPISGFPKSPSDGQLYDDVTGAPLLIDRASQFPINPNTNVPFDPANGEPLSSPVLTPPIASRVEPTTAPSISGLSNDPFLDVLKPGDLSLLNIAPAAIAEAINDAAQHPSPNDPNVRGWQEFGCFASNNFFDGTLTATVAVSGDIEIAMAPQVCIGLCVTQGADYSFVIGNSCYCSVTPPPAGTGSTRCTTPCEGDSSLLCGHPTDEGYSVFKRLVTTNSVVPLPLRPAPNDYQYSGCYLGNDFIASASFVSQGSAGIEDCSKVAATQNLDFAALQGDTCHASNTAPSRYLEVGIGLCSTPCTDNALEACGGTAAAVNTAADLTQLITVYAAGPPPPIDARTPDTSVTGPTGPDGMFVGGCFSASTFILDAISSGRQFSYAQDPVVENSGAKCFAQCSADGFNYALTSWASCYCSNTAPTTPAANQTDCKFTCPKNPDERCGGQGDPNSPADNVLGNVYSRLAIDPQLLAAAVAPSFRPAS